MPTELYKDRDTESQGGLCVCGGDNENETKVKERDRERKREREINIGDIYSEKIGSEVKHQQHPIISLIMSRRWKGLRIF